MSGGKAVVAAVWVFAVVCLLLPGGSGVVAIGRMLFWALLVAHAVELGFFWRTLQRTGEPMGGHALQVMLFGILHYKEVRERMAPEEGA